jgi:hypothetical protein
MGSESMQIFHVVGVCCCAHGLYGKWQQYMKFRMLLIWVPHALLVGRVVNVPLQYIGRDLLFAGNAIVQGLLAIT